ncbi:MAG: hypothetical protein KAI47_06690, partial [Deltaproteobacteria bacterium]|nr:hypothetical protein [Deltaproteobacteria bacterium]
ETLRDEATDQASAAREQFTPQVATARQQTEAHLGALDKRVDQAREKLEGKLTEAASTLPSPDTFRGEVASFQAAGQSEIDRFSLELDAQLSKR